MLRTLLIKILVKWIITNSLGNNTKRIIQGCNKTSFQIWNILRKSYTKSEEQQKIDLKEEIDNMKYSINDDINTFIAMLQNSINALENLEGDMADPIKSGILNRALPKNLRFINVLRYKSNWNKCYEYVKDVIPEIIFSNNKEIKQSKPITRYSHSKFKNSKNFKNFNKSKNINKPKFSINKRKNSKCSICNKYEHYSYDC